MFRGDQVEVIVNHETLYSIEDDNLPQEYHIDYG